MQNLSGDARTKLLAKRPFWSTGFGAALGALMALMAAADTLLRLTAPASLALALFAVSRWNERKATTRYANARPLAPDALEPTTVWATWRATLSVLGPLSSAMFWAALATPMLAAFVGWGGLGLATVLADAVVVGLGLCGGHVFRGRVIAVHNYDVEMASRFATLPGGSKSELMGRRFEYLPAGGHSLAAPPAAMGSEIARDRAKFEREVANQFPGMMLADDSDGTRIDVVPADEETLRRRDALAASGGLLAGHLPEVVGPNTADEVHSNPAPSRLRLTVEDLL